MPSQDTRARADGGSSAAVATDRATANPITGAWDWFSDHVIEPTHEAVDHLLGNTGFGNSGIHDLLFGKDQTPDSPTTDTPTTTPTTTTTTTLPETSTETPDTSVALPTTAKEADSSFVTQFYTKDWNPEGPSGSTNCGPASLAMLMNTMGKMPAGLNPEQQIDHARALMYPNDANIQTVTINGQDVEILDEDHSLTTKAAVAEGITNAGGNGKEDSGWDALDERLANGSPAVLYGYLDNDWRAKFPDRVGSGDLNHFNSVVGKTKDGKYIVMDPMHTGGPVEMSKEDLAEFFDSGTPDFIAWDKPDKSASAAAAGEK